MVVDNNLITFEVISSTFSSNFPFALTSSFLGDCFLRISIYINLSQATIKGVGVFFSPIPITCIPASLSLVANFVKSLSLETRQNPFTFSE